jgi:serpin B
MLKFVRGIAIVLQGLFLLPFSTATRAADRDLALAMAASPNPAKAGEQLTYSLSVTNKGDKTAKRIILIDSLSVNAQLISVSPGCRIADNKAGTNNTLICKARRLLPGASLSWSFIVQPKGAGELVNTATVKLEKRDSNPTDNTFSLSTTILSSADSLATEPAKTSPDSNSPAAEPTKTSPASNSLAAEPVKTTSPGPNSPAAEPTETSPGSNSLAAEPTKTSPGSNSPAAEPAKTTSPGSNSHAAESTKTSPGPNSPAAESAKTSPGSNSHAAESAKTSPGSNSPAAEPAKTSPGSNSLAADPDKIAMPAMQANAMREYNPAIQAGELETIATANIALAFDLYTVFRQDTTGNFVFSTSDVAQSLAMLAAGAEGNTLTAVLEASRIDLPEMRLHPAMNAAALDLTNRNQAARLEQNTALWGQGRSEAHAQSSYLFASWFLNTMAEHYGPEMTALDFTDPAANYPIIGDSIDPWIAAHTNDDIKPLVGGLPERPRLVSASVTSLNGSWQVPPDASPTTMGRFELLNDIQVLAPMMSFSGQFAYAEGDGYRAFELPLAGSDLALTVLMPEHGRFAEFQSAFNLDRLNNILAAMTFRQVTLHLPKIMINTRGSLAGGFLATLEQSGAFAEGQADFSRVNGEGYLFLEHPVHGTIVSLGEDGAKADGATVVVHRATKDEPDKVWGGSYSAGVFGRMGNFSFCEPISHYDPALALARPFLFAIRDRATGSVLFMGQLTTPDGDLAPPDWTTNPCQIYEIYETTVGGFLN